MYTQRRTDSGLFAVEQYGDERQIGRKLRQLDDRLRLLRELDPSGRWRWDVVYHVSDDRPAVSICSWIAADGTPLPLSSGLVDLVVRLRPEARSRRGPDTDQRNKQLERKRDAERRDQTDSLQDDFEPYLERERVGVGMSTRAKKPYWQRNKQKRRR